MAGSASASTSHGRASTSYFLGIVGLPTHYTWQHLKDLIRQKATHGIYTDMFVYPGMPSSGAGWARVQRYDEALRLYRHLVEKEVEGRRLQVHLYDITSQARLITCNCRGGVCSYASSQVNELRRAVSQPGWQAVSSNPGAVAAPTMQAYPAASQYQTQQGLVAAVANMQLQGPPSTGLTTQQQYYQAQANAQMALTQRQQMVSAPQYLTGAAGTPVNVSQGAVRTETRGIFISGLHYKATESDVRAYFGRLGKIVKCEIQKDSAQRKSKGNATILFSTPEEATRAVACHGQSFQGSRMSVRYDKETTAIAPPSSSAVAQPSRAPSQPIIADGSSSLPQSRKDSGASYYAK